MLLSAGGALDGCCYCLEVFGWMLLSAGGLHGCCYPLGGFGWMLLLPGLLSAGGLWMDAVIAWRSLDECYCLDVFG